MKSLKKYRKIILFLLIFLVILIASLIFSKSIPAHIKQHSYAVNLVNILQVNRQKMLIDLYRVKNAAELGFAADSEMTQLTKSHTRFNEILDAFIYGGELIGMGMGQDEFLMDTHFTQVYRDSLTKIETTYGSYRNKIGSVAYLSWKDDVSGEEIIEKAEAAILEESKINHFLDQYEKELTVSLKQDFDKDISRLFQVQIVLLLSLLAIVSLLVY